MAIPTLRCLVGTPGAITAVRADPGAPWTQLGNESSQEDAPVRSQTHPGTHRNPVRAPVRSGIAHSGRRTRGQTRAHRIGIVVVKPCLAPPVEPLAQAAYATAELDWDAALCTGDVFLTEKFRERWCRCDECLPSLEAHPYLLEEEETYEPPEDPDSGLSLEELGMRALERLPRDRAIDGILAFNAMRDNLRAYLRPFAEEGKVVAEADVQTFFEQLNKARAEANA
ncbi:hypothetical protein B0H13DRAFT_1055333 [Mycena leptocephala]|nr:hypothetical protein B0H13DRAFT_1055333 [Mycena leptocephala]